MKTRSTWDRPEYMGACFWFATHLHCDRRCGAELTIEEYGADDAAGRDHRERLLLDRARREAWSVDGEAHVCPGCRARALAEGTAPTAAPIPEGT